MLEFRGWVHWFGVVRHGSGVWALDLGWWSAGSGVWTLDLGLERPRSEGLGSRSGVAGLDLGFSPKSEVAEPLAWWLSLGFGVCPAILGSCLGGGAVPRL